MLQFHYRYTVGAEIQISFRRFQAPAESQEDDVPTIRTFEANRDLTL